MKKTIPILAVTALSAQLFTVGIAHTEGAPPPAPTAQAKPPPPVLAAAAIPPKEAPAAPLEGGAPEGATPVKPAALKAPTVLRASRPRTVATSRAKPQVAAPAPASPRRDPSGNGKRACFDDTCDA